MTVSRKMLFVVLGAVVLIAAVAGVYFFLAPGEAPQAAAAATSPAGGSVITAHDMTQGNPKAPVVVIEYAAPRCPHCAHFNADVFPLLKQNYIDTGKVYYVFRVLPLAAGDGVAEKLARCLPKDRYFPFMDALFRNQARWDDEFGVTDVRGGLLKLAQQAGMSEDQFNACLADSREDAVINQVAQDGVSRYGLDSTPSMVINGKLKPGMAEWDHLKAALDQALAKKS
jgi:protein-disulfide isomerase